jgi:hypothetical protein
MEWIPLTEFCWDRWVFSAVWVEDFILSLPNLFYLISGNKLESLIKNFRQCRAGAYPPSTKKNTLYFSRANTASVSLSVRLMCLMHARVLHYHTATACKLYTIHPPPQPAGHEYCSPLPWEHEVCNVTTIRTYPPPLQARARARTHRNARLEDGSQYCSQCLGWLLQANTSNCSSPSSASLRSTAPVNPPPPALQDPVDHTSCDRARHVQIDGDTCRSTYCSSMDVPGRHATTVTGATETWLPSKLPILFPLPYIQPPAAAYLDQP